MTDLKYEIIISDFFYLLSFLGNHSTLFSWSKSYGVFVVQRLKYTALGNIIRRIKEKSTRTKKYLNPIMNIKIHLLALYRSVYSFESEANTFISNALNCRVDLNLKLITYIPLTSLKLKLWLP